METVLEFDVIQSGLALLLFLALGDFLSTLGKGMLPSILVAGLLYTGCSWAGLVPADLFQRAGLSALSSIAMLLLILHMGASMSIKELWANWRVVALATASFVCQLIMLFLVIGGIFGLNVAVGGLPGGSAVAMIVQERARELGYDHIVVLSVLILSVQALVACPIAVWGVRREARSLLAHPQKMDEDVPITSQKPKSPKGGSTYLALCKLYAAAWAAARLELLTGVSRYILCIFLGVLLATVGFLDRDELANTKSEGFLYFLMMSSILSGFSAATPEKLLQVLPMLAAVLGCEICSIVLFAPLIGRALGFSRVMSIALGVNVMIGFPLNLMLSQEVVGYLTKDPVERIFLTEQLGSKMVIAGLTSTTILATATAGVLISLMH